MQIMQHMHMHKAVTGHLEANKLLSRRRQSDYSSDVGKYYGYGRIPAKLDEISFKYFSALFECIFKTEYSK